MYLDFKWKGCICQGIIDKAKADGKTGYEGVHKSPSESAPVFRDYDTALQEITALSEDRRALYMAVVEGSSHLNEIVTKVGETSGTCTNYLKTLIDLDIIKKETPITEKPGKKTIYLLADNFSDSGTGLPLLIPVQLTPAGSAQLTRNR